MRFFCFALATTLILSCSNSKTNRSNPIHYLPEQATVIIGFNSVESLKSSIKNNDFLNHFSNTTSYSDLASKLRFCELLNPKSKLILGIGKNKQDSLFFSLVTKYHKGLFVRDSLQNYIEETLKYNNKTIIKSTLNKEIIYSTFIDSIFMVSSSESIIEEAHKQVIIDDMLEKINSTMGSDKAVSCIIKPNNPFFKSLFINDSLSYNRFTNYTALEVDINQNKITFNGITKAIDSTMSIINVFKHTIPQENQVQLIAPSNSDGFMSFTFHDFNTLKNNLTQFNQKDSIIEQYNSLFENIIEVGVIYQGKSQAVVLNSIDVIATTDALLAEQTKADTYRQVDIFNFSQFDVFSKTFQPLITHSNFYFYCVLDSFFVFADTMDMLQNIIANYQNKTTLSEFTPYKDNQEGLSSASSLMFVANGETLKNVVSKNIEDNLSFNLNNYKTSVLQFVYDSNFAHVNGIISKNKARAIEQAVTEEFSIKLDSDLLNSPQFVTNHRTREKEIVVQDIKNNLYLISNQGKILWKKQLHGPVLGNIEQIDIYKNGRLQLAFTTPHRLYIIDRNGKDVAPFPGKFNDEITQPLSVFDYDRNKNYRLLVTQGKNLLMYDKRAKPVSGFIFKGTNDDVIYQPQHFRIGSKDYLTIKTKNKVHILDRTGRNRVTPKTNSDYSNEAIYLYKDKFTTTSIDGKLITIDTKGNTAFQDLNLLAQHHIYTSSKTLVTQSDNKLSIKSKTRELDYGNYSPPKLFYINDKIYVTLTDLQAQKIYLFDSQNEMLPNFPVYGNSLIDLDNIDKDRNLEFVTKGDNNTIILYQIN
ncbi:ribonuclease HII [Aestuariivivens marinum]|uniref:ribonuclease HII n=1 Tax=Aestuariivivens marinum TaxID=2913555 RepID=UPI001F587401|nr:ribonuclease HII [Aestuariivivens marinum]